MRCSSPCSRTVSCCARNDQGSQKSSISVGFKPFWSGAISSSPSEASVVQNSSVAHRTVHSNWGKDVHTAPLRNETSIACRRYESAHHNVLESHRRIEPCRDATRAPRRPCMRQAVPLPLAVCRLDAACRRKPKATNPGFWGTESPDPIN
jgi:hypothetical protein